MATGRYLERKGLKAFDSNSNEYLRNLAKLCLYGDDNAYKELTFILLAVKNG